MIAFFDYRPAYLKIKAEIDEAIERVLGSGRLILGPEVRAFELEFAESVRLPAAVAVNSGTDALILALRALDVGPGDEVITVANAGVPPVAAIRAAGATPRFVDVLPRTLLIDPDRLERALSPKTRCVLPVHLYGQPADLGPILEFAERHGLRVVEDCAQAHGATYRGQPVGGFGDIGCYSFYPTKNLGAFGDGGMAVTGDPALEDRMRMQRMYGYRNDRHAHCEGLNSRLDELQAAILRVRLGHLAQDNATRQTLARRYLDGLRGSAYELPLPAADRTHVYHLFVIRTAERERVIGELRRAGIGFGLHYPEPVHRMEAYRFLDRGEGELPVSERACASVLSLPLHPGLEPQAVDRVVELLLGVNDRR